MQIVFVKPLMKNGFLFQKTDPQLLITAKTAPVHNASTKILQKNGFEFSGKVQDDEIGDAWLWVLKTDH